MCPHGARASTNVVLSWGHGILFAIFNVMCNFQTYFYDWYPEHFSGNYSHCLLWMWWSITKLLKTWSYISKSNCHFVTMHQRHLTPDELLTPEWATRMTWANAPLLLLLLPALFLLLKYSLFFSSTPVLTSSIDIVFVLSTVLQACAMYRNLFYNCYDQLKTKPRCICIFSLSGWRGTLVAYVFLSVYQTGPKTSPEPHRRIIINILRILLPITQASTCSIGWSDSSCWHFLAATAINPQKVACHFAADDILLYKFCYYYPMDIYFTN